jgi:hypothetical protein
MVSFKMLAQIAWGIEGFEQVFDGRVGGFEGGAPSIAEEASTASLRPIGHSHKDVSDCST